MMSPKNELKKTSVSKNMVPPMKNLRSPGKPPIKNLRSPGKPPIKKLLSPGKSPIKKLSSEMLPRNQEQG